MKETGTLISSYLWRHHRFCTENQQKRDAEDIRRGEDAL